MEGPRAAAGPGQHSRPTSEADLSSETTIGEYRILGELGQGGMGVVYRAQHRDTGEPAALKTVLAPRASLLHGIRREIRALARVRHPGVARIVAEGLHEGRPWYAMELVEGTTLRRHCQRLRQNPAGWMPTTIAASDTTERTGETRTEPERLEAIGPAAGPEEVHSSGLALENGSVRAAVPENGRSVLPSAVLHESLALVRRLCAPLAFLHGEGIVHRDLKPENVLVRPDGLPVIVDFGLVSQVASTASRESLENIGAGGTAAYMAPEQVRGELVDARADLYSLGCILYELLTGQPPFLGASLGQVLKQHLRAEPLPPSQHSPGLPRELDELVLRLLQKQPRQRLGHADVVAASLARLTAEDGRPASGPPPRAYLYRPGFCGRDDELARLEGPLSEAAQGRGCLALLGGESGVGKTRLVLELAQRGAERGVQMWLGECVPGGLREPAGTAAAGGPLHPFRRVFHAIADRCRDRGRREYERLLGRNGRVLALYEPGLAALPGQEAHPAPPELPASAALQRLYGALASVLGALARDEPRLLVLDDLQWADDLTLGFLEFLQRTGELLQTRLVILGTYRPEEAGGPLRALGEAAGVVHLRLGRLDDEAVGAMAAQMLAVDSPPADFTQFLARHSEGNPFFVAEYLRSAVEAGLLHRDGQGRWQIVEPAEAGAYGELPLPGSVRDLLRGRLDGLPEEARRLVDAAAVAGREAPAVLIRRMARLELPQALDAVSEVLRRLLLEEQGERLRFVHDQIREVVYESLEPARRQALHREAAEGIETLFAAERDEHLAALGHHREQAGETEAAGACYLAAARQAAGRYVLADAERLYRAYLRLSGGPGQQHPEARLQLALQVLRVQGRLAEAVQEAELAAEQARALADRPAEASALGGLGILYNELGQSQKAMAALEPALRIHRELDDRWNEGIDLAAQAAAHYNLDRPEEARKLYQQALAIHRETGDRKSEGTALGRLAALERLQGRLDLAHSLCAQAIEIHRAAGDRWSEGLCVGTLAMYLHDQGHLAEARPLYEQALQVHREIGARHTEGKILAHLAMLLQNQQEWPAAEALYEQALALHRAVGDREFQGWTLGALATLLLEQGRIPEAIQQCETALAIHRELGIRRLQGEVLRVLAALRRQGHGDLDSAERLILEAESIDTEVANVNGRIVCLCERGHQELMRGRSAEALLRQAQALASGLGLQPDSVLGATIQRLDDTQQAYTAGRALFRGEPLQDLPDGLRRWLAETGQLPAASAD